jgi:hypothetical protein
MLKLDEPAYMVKWCASIDEGWDKLTDWEKKFAEDMVERFTQYKIYITISKKQWEIIDRIGEKVGL